MNTYQHYTDTELLGLLITGDNKAFETIYFKYVYDLLDYARRNIPVPEECEEIVQEVFVAIWARRKELAIESLRGYLFGMVRHRIVKYFRCNAVRKRYAEHYLVFETLYDSMNEDSIDEPLLEAVIEKSLKDLPGRCGDAVRLRIYENLSNAEIAQRMNVTKKTVENYVVMFTAHFRELHTNVRRPKMRLAMMFFSLLL